jgi:hypothetical protein
MAMDKAQKTKLVFVVLLGLAAIFLILYNLGVFEGKPKPVQIAPVLTPDQQKDLEKTNQQRQELEKRLGPPKGA